MQSIFTSLTQHVLVPKESYELILEYAQTHEDHRTFIPDVEFTDYNESFSVMNKFIEDALSSISTRNYSDEQISIATQKFITESARLWPTTEVYHNRILKYMEDAYRIPEKAQAARDKLMVEHSDHADAITYMYTKYLEAYASRVMNDMEYISNYTQGVPTSMNESFDPDFHGYYMSEDLGNQLMAIPGMIIQMIRKLMNGLSYTLSESGKAFANRILKDGQIDEEVIKKLYELYVAKNKAGAQPPIRYPNPQKVHELRQAYATGFETFTSQMVGLVEKNDFKSIDTGVIQMIQRFQVVSTNETLPRSASFQEFRTAILSIANNVLLMDMFMKSLTTIDDALWAKYGADPKAMNDMIEGGKGDKNVDNQFQAGMNQRAVAKPERTDASVEFDPADIMFESEGTDKLIGLLGGVGFAGEIAGCIQEGVERIVALVEDHDILRFLGLQRFTAVIDTAKGMLGAEAAIDDSLFTEDGQPPAATAAQPAAAPAQQPAPQAAPAQSDSNVEGGETASPEELAELEKALGGHLNPNGEITAAAENTENLLSWIQKIPKVGPAIQQIITGTMNRLWTFLQTAYDKLKTEFVTTDDQPNPQSDPTADKKDPKAPDANPPATTDTARTGKMKATVTKKGAPAPSTPVGSKPAQSVGTPQKASADMYSDGSEYMHEGPVGEAIASTKDFGNKVGTAANLILSAKGILAVARSIKSFAKDGSIDFKDAAWIAIGIMNAKKLIGKVSQNEKVQAGVEQGKRAVKKAVRNTVDASKPQDGIARNFGADENIIGTMRRLAQDKADWKTAMSDKYMQKHVRMMAMILVGVSVLVVIQRVVFGNNSKSGLRTSAGRFAKGTPAKHVSLVSAINTTRSAVTPLAAQLWQKSDQAIKNLWTYINGWLYGGQTVKVDGKQVKTVGLGQIIKDELTSISSYVNLKDVIKIDLPDNNQQR